LVYIYIYVGYQVRRLVSICCSILASSDTFCVNMEWPHFTFAQW